MKLNFPYIKIILTYSFPAVEAKQEDLIVLQCYGEFCLKLAHGKLNISFPMHSIRRTRAHRISVTRREPGQCWGRAVLGSSLSPCQPLGELTISSLTPTEMGSFHSQRKGPSIPVTNLQQKARVCTASITTVLRAGPSQSRNDDHRYGLQSQPKKEQGNRKQILAQQNQKITFTWWKAKDG